MKIVKNRKVEKLPKANGSVRATFANAEKAAREGAWEKVIIIGHGKVRGNYYTSRIGDYEVLGMLAKVKHAILTEE